MLAQALLQLSAAELAFRLDHGALTYRPHLRLQRLPNTSSGSRIIRLPDDQAGLMGFGHQWKSTLP